MTEATYEHHFITRDMAPDNREVVFNMIEDESGEIFWGYGHREADEFLGEVNRWAIHTCEVDPDMGIPNDHRVEHLWAHDHDGERFQLCDKDTPDAFPVTRLML